jgi:hypothetical protein
MPAEPAVKATQQQHTADGGRCAPPLMLEALRQADTGSKQEVNVIDPGGADSHAVVSI